MAEKPGKLTIKFKDANIPPFYANLVDINRLETTIFVDFSSFDAVGLVRQMEARKKEKPGEPVEIEIEAEPSIRIAMDYRTFMLLREKVNLLYGKIKDDAVFSAHVDSKTPGV